MDSGFEGFLVVRGLLAAEEIRALNDALDANLDKTSDHVPPGGLENTALEGDKSPYVHFSGMLTWDQPWCQPFRDLLAHKNILPYLNAGLRQVLRRPPGNLSPHLLKSR